MQTIKGRYNIARIMIPPQVHLDEATYEQIHRFLDHPAFEGEPISIMPDCHAGKGSVIGFTMPLGDKVIPNVVGVDIGCGVLSLPLGDCVPDLRELDRLIRQKIPYGFAVRENIHPEVQKHSALILNIQKSCSATGQDSHRVLRALGSLGGGNHFIELGKDESGSFWLTIHSGSRHFGLSIAQFYQEMAVRQQNKKESSPDLAWLTAQCGSQDYLRDMETAQRYAALNREIFARDILTALQADYTEKNTVHSVHNYIDFEDRMVRKGAIRARDGNPVVIPFNMRDGLIIGRGRAGREWNFSAPHGAGRLLSRHQARKKLSLERARQEMRQSGIFTTSLNNRSLDEAAGAYKDKDMILEALKDTVEIEHRVLPVYNFKDH